MESDSQARECPYCKEPIYPQATVCKHCRSRVQPVHPPHGGVCPFCKEEIKADAIKCKHCGSLVGAAPAKRKVVALTVVNLPHLCRTYPWKCHTGWDLWPQGKALAPLQ